MQRVLRNVGFLLLLLGASSFLFPLMGMRSRIMSAFNEHEKLAAGIFLGAGAIVFAISFRGKKDETKPPPPG